MLWQVWIDCEAQWLFIFHLTVRIQSIHKAHTVWISEEHILTVNEAKLIDYTSSELTTWKQKKLKSMDWQFWNDDFAVSLFMFIFKRHKDQVR